MSSEEHPILSHFRISRIAGGVALLLGLTVLLGWALNVEFLKRFSDEFVAMNPMTAVGFLGLGAALLSLKNGNRVPMIVGLVPLLIGGVKLASLIWPGLFAIDTLLFSARLEWPSGSMPNRIAPNTALCLLLSALALGLGLASSARLRWGGQLISLAVMLISYLALFGYFMGAAGLYTIGFFIPMAVHTAAGFFLVSLGLFFMHPREGLAWEITNSTYGGLIARKVLPAVLVLPLPLAWLRLEGERAGFYGRELGVALFSVACVLLALLLVFSVASGLRRLHEARLAAQAKLQRAYDQLNQLLQNTPSLAVQIYDQEGRVLLWNRSSTEVFGYTAEQALGKRLGELILSGSEAARFEREILRVMQTRRPTAVQEWNVTTADGESRAILSSIFPIEIDSEPRVVCMDFDITLRKQQEREVESARDRAELAAGLKSEFLAKMSHEIRNPMNGLIGMLELTLQTHLLPEQRAYLETANASAEALIKILNDILDFSKMEAGRLQLDPVELEVRDVAAQAVRTLAVIAEQNGTELLLRVGPKVPSRVLGDPVRLGQVLLNLISNGIKAAKNGTVLVELDWLEQSEKALTIAVSDTGPGIPPEQQARLFQSFQQLGNPGAEGTGLGLVISAQLVRLMGGAIEVLCPAQPGMETEPVRFSTTFRVSLPPGRAPGAEQGRPLAGIHCLVIGKAGLFSRILLELLESLGARARIAEGPFDPLQVENGMVLWDVASGIPLPPVLRPGVRPGTPRILCLLPMLPNDEQFRQCTHSGMGYLLKPIRRIEVVNAILGASERSPSPPRSPEKSLHALNVLVADDNTINQRTTREMLVRDGHLVSVAHNGIEALVLWENNRFDLVILDIRMPEMDGLEAAKEIRSREAARGLPRTPLVALTGLAFEQDKRRCREAGFDDLLVKPVRFAEFRGCIASLGLKGARFREA